ncbi:MAG: hypothetical protein ACOCUS_00795 [Polyangiales bacterium]
MASVARTTLTVGAAGAGVGAVVGATAGLVLAENTAAGLWGGALVGAVGGGGLFGFAAYLGARAGESLRDEIDDATSFFGGDDG